MFWSLFLCQFPALYGSPFFGFITELWVHHGIVGSSRKCVVNSPTDSIVSRDEWSDSCVRSSEVVLLAAHNRTLSLADPAGDAPPGLPLCCFPAGSRFLTSSLRVIKRVRLWLVNMRSYKPIFVLGARSDATTTHFRDQPHCVVVAVFLCYKAWLALVDSQLSAWLRRSFPVPFMYFAPFWFSFWNATM